MGRIDTITKKYMSNNKKFADVFNYFIYGGKQVIAPEELMEKDTTELGVLLDENGIYTKQRYRDILKRCIIKKDDISTYILLGIENQTEINYVMPVRNMLYDALNYTSQVEVIVKKHKECKDLNKAEFLSGFTEHDKIEPVITVVVYFGGDEWNAPRSLYDMFSTKNIELLKFVNDYKINLIVPNEIKDTENFHTDFRHVVNFIKASNDKEELKALMKKERDTFSRLSSDVVMVLKECANIKISIDQKEGVIDMCKAIEDMMIDKETETIIKLYIKDLLSDKNAAEELNLSLQDFYKKVEEYKQKVYK